MKKKVLFISDFYTSCDFTEMVCYGLGSCIGLFLQDRRLKITSGAHIPVVKTCVNTGFLSAEEIVYKMFTQLGELGSDLKALRAKVVGGANLYNSSFEIGKRNIEAINELLLYNKVYIAGQDLGGNVARTVHFVSTTGECHIQTSSSKGYII
ncbi:chemotaxis protein CheD [Marivirga arenosa]|uniref:Chemotaxis protein CheD n=1 Tax=Marivirga arenosa TaxID=3059076 RepID=A0AA49JCT3_9BACT|nr:chemotaxis protein CheD [Marivirga sp. BKB1-2]WKK81610.1 chemotaxis protein CheD [Marivirga sp. BKB1-2]